MVILLGATESEHGDLRTPFFQESNFYYLTGWNEPGAILVLTADQEILFIPRPDPKREIWTGPMTDPAGDDIGGRTGFSDVRAAETFESSLPEIAEGGATIHTLLERPSAVKLRAMLPLREFSDIRPPSPGSE